MQNQYERAQRFFAADMSSALKMLTDAYGADALLLSSRRVGSGVEVIGMPPGGEAPPQDSGRTSPAVPVQHSERRVGERRSSERRAVSADQDDAGASSGDDQGADRRRRDFGDTLAKLSEQHADLLSQRDTEPGALRRAAAELAQRIGLPAESGAAGERAESLFAPGVAPGAAPAQAAEGSADDVRGELRALREVLGDALATQDSALPGPARYMVLRRLAAMGLSPAVGKALVEAAADGEFDEADVPGLWSACRDRLAALLPLLEQDVLAGGGVFALTGPSGSGKSSLAAALLARAVSRREHGELAIFYTPGAQNPTLAELAGLAAVPYIALRGDAPLNQQLAAQAQRRCVLVDTAGQSRWLANGWREQAEALGLREILAMPATGEQRYLRDMLAEYRSPLTFCAALTFYQRAGNIGALLSLLLSERLALALAASDPLLPEKLRQPDASWLLQELGFALACEPDDALLAPLVTEPAEAQADAAMR